MMERYTLPQKLLFIKTYYSTTRPHSFAVAVSKLREMLEPELVPTEDVLRELIQKFRTTGSIVNGPPQLPAQKPAAVRKIANVQEVIVPPISDFSSSEEDELPQKSFDQHQYHERYQIQSNGYTSRRKSDPRLPAMRPSKVPRQEQQAVSASTVVVSSQQLPISQMTVSGSMPCSDPYSVDAPIAFIATLDYPESADTENAELEPSIKLEVKEEVVEPEDSNQQFVMATKHEQQISCSGEESYQESGLPDFTLSQIKQEIKSEVLDEIPPERLDQGLTTPIIVKIEPKDNDENLLGI